MHAGDREIDIYEPYRKVREPGTHFAVRTCVDRLAGDDGYTIADEKDEVLVAGPDAATAVDPVLIAARGDYAAFRETLSTFPEADLKKMITNLGLGTAEDVRRVTTKPKKMGYIDVMWDGSKRKLGERGG